MNEEHFTFHLQYKYPDTFANRKYEQLSYPQKNEERERNSYQSQNLVHEENVRPHSSNSFENATPLMFNLIVKMRPHPAAHPH